GSDRPGSRAGLGVSRLLDSRVPQDGLQVPVSSPAAVQPGHRPLGVSPRRTPGHRRLAASMKFDRTHSFEYAIEEQVAPDLVRITARNPGVMTFHGTGTYLVGRRHGAVIDPGPKLEEHRLAVAAAVDGGELEHILV